MQQTQANRALRLNLDKSLKSLSAEECFFLLNNERYLNLDGSLKGNLSESTPLVANYPACEMDMPKGSNHAVGKYYSQLTKELYFWVYNSNGVHWIQRINSKGVCEIVYDGECPIPLSADPKHEITKFRAYLKLDKLCANRHGKSLIWINGDSVIGQIDVEASIATNSFRTPFFQRCAEGCEVIEMCVPDPCDCLKGEFVPLPDNERGKANNMVDVAIQISYQHIYYDGRESIWSDPSKPFIQDVGQCFDNESGFARCLKLRVPVGNPLVDKIRIAYKKDNVWYLYDTIDKYKKYNNTQQYWYERSLAELTNYSDSDCSFDYFFCNDKQCDVLDSSEFTRVYNPMPIKPQAILPIGIGEDQTALGFVNYEQGSCPIDKTEIEKISFTPECSEDDCNVEYATVKARVIIHNRFQDRNQFIYRLGGTSGGADDTSDKAYFGGLNDALSGFLSGFDQYFNGETRNFIAYVEGTDYWSPMTQWKSHAFFAGREEWGIVNDMDTESTRNRWRRATRNGEFFYQEVSIRVIKGTRGFIRLSSHHSTDNDQNTSTFVIGTQDLYKYKGNNSLGEGFVEGVEELYFDTCDGDVDILEALVVDDNAVKEFDTAVFITASAYHGYIKDNNGLPVEGAIVESPDGGFSSKTDHNGFYHFYIHPGEDDPVTIRVKVEQDCYNFTEITSDSVQGAAGENTRHDLVIDDETYQNGFYGTVKVLVQDCDGNPVGGVRVALSGSKYDATGADGYARIRVRNYETRDRQLRFVVLNNKGCFGSDCAGACNPCMPTGTTTAPNCFYTKPQIGFTPAIVNRDYAARSSRGLKAGGRYPFAVAVAGDCGFHSAPYLVNYLDMPKTQDKGKEGFCDIAYDARGTIWPSWAKCLKILRGVNVNPFELQWIVDKIEKVDGKIKLTIQSLNDYNEKYFFKTNTIYQWLKGDRVEFIKNGDGSIFKTVDHGLLNFLTLSPMHDEQASGEDEPPADYFNQLLIDDDGRLDMLTEGAVIELQRAKDCSTPPIFYTICVSIPIVNGKLLYETGIFETFDTFFVKRTIGTKPIQQFEHKFPSDHWGELVDGQGISDIGRGHVENKFENKRRYGRNITVNSPYVYNRFGDMVKVLNPDQHGDIVAAYIYDNKVGLAISEHDNSLFEVGDDLLKVGGDGIVRAATSDQVISDSQSKVSGQFGCQYEQIGSIFFGDGYVTWWDVSKGTYVIHDFNIAKPADEGQAQSYFRRRSQELMRSNSTETDPLKKLRVVTGINTHTGALAITVKALQDPGIYNEPAPYKKKYDTILYHPIAQDFLTFASFVPELYGELILEDTYGCAFVAFLNGIPYIHTVVPLKWNEFFGVAVDRVVGMSMNKFPEKLKKGLSIEVQDQTMWFVQNVSTERANFRSEIPPIKWASDRVKWNAAFLRDINSIGGLYNGTEVEGYYHAVTFIRDNTDALKYNTTNDAKRVKFDLLDQIIFKFKMSEQAGFTENL